MTPKQLLAIAGEGGKDEKRTFGSLAEAAEHYRQQRLKSKA